MFPDVAKLTTATSHHGAHHRIRVKNIKTKDAGAPQQSCTWRKAVLGRFRGSREIFLDQIAHILCWLPPPLFSQCAVPQLLVQLSKRFLWLTREEKESSASFCIPRPHVCVLSAKGQAPHYGQVRFLWQPLCHLVLNWIIHKKDELILSLGKESSLGMSS